VGTAAGLTLGPLQTLLPKTLGVSGPLPTPLDVTAPVTPGASIAWLLSVVVQSTFWVLGIVLFLILARRLVRVGWLAGAIVTLLFASSVFETLNLVTLPLTLLSVGIVVATAVRFGLLPAILAEACSRIFGYFIFSRDPSHWAFYAGMIPVAFTVALSLWAARSALAGRPLLGGTGSLEA